MTIIVQLLLVLGVAYGALTLVRGGVNAKHQAIRRLVGVAFFGFAALSIFLAGFFVGVQGNQRILTHVVNI